MATNFWTIRDAMIASIENLAPSYLADDAKKFRRSPTNHQLRNWAPKNTGACFRKFEIALDETQADPPFMDPGAREVNESCLISVAYPTSPALYGANEYDDLEKIMRSDARQVRDVVFDPGNYVAGQSAAFVTRLPIDRQEDDVWYQDFKVDLIYLEAQTLGVTPVAPTITLGAGAGSGAVVDTSTFKDTLNGTAAGTITFTTGSGPASGTLLTLTFSQTVYGVSFTNNSANASSADLVEQLYVSGTGVSALPVLYSGTSLSSSTQYSFVYSVTF